MKRKIASYDTATHERIARYLGKRVGLARILNRQAEAEGTHKLYVLSDAAAMLTFFMIDPFEVGEVNADDTHTQNIAFFKALTAGHRKVLEMDITMASAEWERELAGGSPPVRG
jgi:hypothetical protein